MKKNHLVLLFFLCVANCYGQRVDVEIIKEKHPQKIYAKVEIKSAFPGGDSSWVKSIERHLTQSLQNSKQFKEGKYIVSMAFIVSKDGSLSDIECLNDPGIDMCEAVLRVFMKTKNWNPAGYKPSHVISSKPD
jgi:hypothetical protein